MDLHKTLGILGTPHGNSIDKIWSTKTCSNKRNRRNHTKNASNPREEKTPKLSPLAHGFWRGIKWRRATRGPCIHQPPNPKEKGLKTATRNSPRKGSETQKGETGETQQSLEEPYQIIYTYREGSYKV
jgi:hypothetical protein